MYRYSVYSFFIFFFNDTATTEIYTLSLHDALPISLAAAAGDQRGRDRHPHESWACAPRQIGGGRGSDRKSTRLNSSHPSISYAVFCLKKKTQIKHRVLTHPLPPAPDCDSYYYCPLD